MIKNTKSFSQSNLKGKTLTELISLVPKSVVDRIILINILMYIWVPVLWLDTLTQSSNLTVNKMGFWCFEVRLLTYFTALFYIIYTLAANKGHIKELLWHTFIRKPMNLCLLILLVVIFISSLCSPDLDTAFNGTFYRQEGFLTYLAYACLFIIAGSIKDKKTVRIIVYNFVAAAFINGLLILFNYLGLIVMDNPDIVRRKYTGWFVNENHYGYYVIFALILLCYLIHDEKGIRRYIFGLEAIFLTWTLMMNNSTGPVVAIIIALLFGIVLAFFSPVLSKKKMISFPVAFVAVCLVISLLPASLGGTKNFVSNFLEFKTDVTDLTTGNGNDHTGSGRIGIWKDAWEKSFDRPLIGHGPDQIYVFYFDRENEYTRAANEYLYIMMAFGIPAVLLYISALLLSATYRLKKIKTLPRHTIFLSLTVLAYAVSAFFGNSVFSIYPYFLIFLAIVPEDADLSALKY